MVTSDCNSHLANRQCRKCLEMLPLDCFRVHTHRVDGSIYRAPDCNACHSKIEIARRKEKRSLEDHRIMASGWASIASAKQRRLSIERLVIELLERFGGTKGLAKAWYREYKQATSNRKMRCIGAVMAMMGWLEDNPDVMLDPSKWSDDRLKDELLTERMRATMDLLRENPLAVSAVCKQFGYRLVAAGPD